MKQTDPLGGIPDDFITGASPEYRESAWRERAFLLRQRVFVLARENERIWAEADAEYRDRIANMHAIMGRQSETLKQLSDELVAVRKHFSEELLKAGNAAMEASLRAEQTGAGYEMYGLPALHNNPPNAIGNDSTSTTAAGFRTLARNSSFRWTDAQGREYGVATSEGLGYPAPEPERLWDDSGSLKSGPPPETPLHVKWTDVADHDPSHNNMVHADMADADLPWGVENTLLVTASALQNAGTTLGQFLDWIAQWWMLAVAKNKPFPQDEGEIVTPPRADW